MFLKRIMLIFTLLLVVTMSTGFAEITKPNIDLNKVSEWPMKTISLGGTLLLSDSPENVTRDGIMYQDTVQGDIRLFFHHVNTMDKPKRVAVMLESVSGEASTVTVTQFGLGGPGYDYLAVGKTAETDYLNGGVLYLVDVPAKGSVVLDSTMLSKVLSPNQLLNGIYDFKAEQPVKVTVMMLPVDIDPETFLKRAQILPADQYKLRGTFAGRDRMLMPKKVYNPSDDGPVAMLLAASEDYIEGIDKTDGSHVVNYGNYGVVYKLFIPSTIGGHFVAYLNPQGGEYAGAIGLKYKYQTEDPVLTPPDSIFFGHKSTDDLALIGSFDAGQSLWMTFTPPGASNLPVRLLLVPYGG